MAFFQRLKNTLLHREQARLRAEEEASFHLEMREEELVGRGHTKAEASRLAKAHFGNVLHIQEQAGDTDLLAGLEGMMRDVKVALRRLRRSPVFLVTGVLLLAIGLGINVAVFSVLDFLFLRPLPYPDGHQLVVIEEQRNGEPSNSNPARLLDWQSRVSAFSAVASTYGETVPLREREGNRSVTVLRMAGDWVGLLGVPVLEGRRFDPRELRGGKVAMLTARGRSLGAIGDTLRLGSDSFRVIGIIDDAVALGEDVQVVTPIAEPLLTGSRKAGYLTGVARLKQGSSLEAAQAEINSVALQLGKLYPETDRGTTVRLVDAKSAWTSEARTPALYVQAAVSLLLLITMVNLAGLLAARAMERSREDQVRLFLGAGRWHLLRLHLVEAGLLVFLGSLASLLIAPASLRLLKQIFGDDFPPILGASIDVVALGFLIAVGVSATLGLAAAMAWQTARESPSRRQSQFQLRNLLVISEAALGLILLAASFQLVGDFAKLRFSPLGIREQGLLTARVYLPWATDSSDLSRAIDQGRERIGALPGVSAVAVVDRIPLEGGSQDSRIWIEGRPESTPQSVGIRMATANYFAVMGIPLLAGTLPVDENAVLVNESFARRYLDRRPLGQNVSINRKSWFRVSGVVADVRYSSRESAARPEVFFNERTQYWPLLTFVIQTSQPASAVAAPLRRLFTEVAPDGDFRGVTTLENRIDDIVSQPRRQRDIVSAFGVVALALVIAGVYGIMGGEMVRRRREMGIRLAIGATRGHIIGLALARAGWLCLAASITGALIVSGLLEDRIQANAVLSAIATIAAGMLLAAFSPAWRASRTNPIEVLRQD